MNKFCSSIFLLFGLKEASLLIYSLSFLICFFVTIQTYAQNSFPDKWIGTWEGDIEIHNQTGLATTIPMSLSIQKTDSAGRWDWTLIYHLENDDKREYELVEIDRETGHYQIDEKNSIILDAYWRGQTLISRFSVSNSLIIANYHFWEEEIHFEIFAGDMATPTITGLEVKEIDKIQSFPISVMQKAILKKK